VTNFWGERWNRVIQDMLKEYAYKPARRLGLPEA
jgi:hypothetical protein